ncbi:uncharacterized protein ddias isoform X1 [Anguilla rostrata]|uniref:uncharacterized protein ddias isoform X1 n=1 Tax=Anguilla rostrata TaxID=7938 RepID=UPI0030CAF15F
MVSGHTQLICSVLSLRDSCVLYPSCPQCVSRLQKKHPELRCSCQKCGFACMEENISYRYRLSLNVKRYNDIFGVTVFGSCLNPYFGIPAVGLQRFYDDALRTAEDPHGDCVRRLLLKAVEDCFVGRQFEFGIKLTGHKTGERSLFNEQGLPELFASNRISGEFVASRITLPNGAAGGSSVLSYFKKLLQASCVVLDCGLPNPERPSVSLEHTDSLAPKSFDCSLASFSGSSSWHSYNVHYFPKYWKRSPGIINSSAEQEEHSYSMQQNGTDVGSQWWCRKSHKCSPGAPSYVLSPQNCSLDVKGEENYNDCSQGSGMGDSRETAESSPSNSFQRSHFSLPDTLELTSSVTESEKHKSPHPGKVEQVELGQNEHLGLKLRWRGVFSLGKDDMSSFQEGLSVCGWNSKLSNSSAWADLPFSESWGEFISEANRPSEVSQENKACDSAKKIEAKLSEAGCVDKIHSCANFHLANASSATEHSCNFIILSGGTTSYLCSAQVREQDSVAVVQQPFIKSPGVCCTENSNLSANDPDVKYNNVFRAHISTSDHLGYASEDQEIRKGDLSRSVPGLRGLTAQGQCNNKVQNEIKEFSCVGGEAKTWGTVFHKDYCISEHKLDGHGASVCDFGWEEQAMPNRGPFYGKDAYNASADLFGICQNSVSIVEEGDKRATPQSECRALKFLRSCRPLVDAYCGDHSMPIEKVHKLRTDKCRLGSEISDPLDFVPFSQSTPISRNLIPVRRLPHRGKDQTPSRGNVSSWHHGCSKTESENTKENVRDRGSEDTVPLSMAKIRCSSTLQSLTRSIKRTDPVVRYRCKRILLASRGRKSCRKILSSRIDNICENTIGTKIRCTLGDSVCVPSSPKWKNCVKSAHLGSEGQRVAEVATSSKSTASENTSTSHLCTDPGGMALDWSADLFVDSFGI